MTADPAPPSAAEPPPEPPEWAEMRAIVRQQWQQGQRQWVLTVDKTGAPTVRAVGPVVRPPGALMVREAGQ